MDITSIIDITKPQQPDMALIACPFCGKETAAYVKYEHAAGLRYAVLCLECTASIDPGWAQQKSVVRDMWNKRVMGGSNNADN